MIDVSLDITLTQGAFTLQLREQAAVEVLGVFGPSGAGKTSLLEAIAGIRTPDRGEIRVGDRVLYSSEQRIDLRPQDRRIGYVPQDALLFPHLSVRANITYGATHADLGPLAGILDLQPLLDRDRKSTRLNSSHT